eukprot:TRINITY_DN1427_c0_g1_i1.p1 TRINITY_DN1427_c0_g1~~TRINITY_DN1427_c0_g1_i1.p1  ORF type:complete len:725 (-),score=72.29 TRINITY_DN1427_c0_g1_i1:384-2558(-)
MRSAIQYDGYQWLKYGQKKLRYKGFTRAYYRCKQRDSNCLATKTVDRCRGEPDRKPEVAYTAEHNHSPPIPRGYIEERSSSDEKQADAVNAFTPSLPSPAWSDPGQTSSVDGVKSNALMISCNRMLSRSVDFIEGKGASGMKDSDFISRVRGIDPIEPQAKALANPLVNLGSVIPSDAATFLIESSRKLLWEASRKAPYLSSLSSACGEAALRAQVLPSAQHISGTQWESGSGRKDGVAKNADEQLTVGADVLERLIGESHKRGREEVLEAIWPKVAAAQPEQVGRQQMDKLLSNFSPHVNVQRVQAVGWGQEKTEMVLMTPALQSTLSSNKRRALNMFAELGTSVNTPQHHDLRMRREEAIDQSSLSRGAANKRWEANEALLRAWPQRESDRIGTWGMLCGPSTMGSGGESSKSVLTNLSPGGSSVRDEASEAEFKHSRFMVKEEVAVLPSCSGVRHVTGRGLREQEIGPMTGMQQLESRDFLSTLKKETEDDRLGSASTLVEGKDSSGLGITLLGRGLEHDWHKTTRLLDSARREAIFSPNTPHSSLLDSPNPLLPTSYSTTTRDSSSPILALSHASKSHFKEHQGATLPLHSINPCTPNHHLMSSFVPRKDGQDTQLPRIYVSPRTAQYGDLLKAGAPLDTNRSTDHEPLLFSHPHVKLLPNEHSIQREREMVEGVPESGKALTMQGPRGDVVSQPRHLLEPKGEGDLGEPSSKLNLELCL